MPKTAAERDAEWLEEVRAGFAAGEQVRAAFRAGMERGEASSVQDPQWPYSLVPKPLPRTIWMYWAQGWDAAPEIVKLCRQTWLRRHPDWRIESLDAASIKRYVDLGGALDGKTIGVAHLADILRLHLLARYGGVWVDATTACARQLDEWLPPLMQSGFFAFSRPRPDRPLANWFLASQPDGEIVSRWLALVERYWSLVSEADHYLWCHYLFAHGCRTDGTLAAGWAATPHVSAHGALQPQLLAFAPETAADVLASVEARTVPVFKLSYGYAMPAGGDQSPLATLLTALLA
jgi:hypothetical protein